MKTLKMSQVKINARLKNNLLCVWRAKGNSSAKNLTYGQSEQLKQLNISLMLFNHNGGKAAQRWVFYLHLSYVELKSKNQNYVLSGIVRVKKKSITKALISNYRGPRELGKTRARNNELAQASKEQWE